jgi:hypothetical protein
MKYSKWIPVLTFMLVCCRPILSDTLVLKDGTVYEGTLKKVTEKKIEFESTNGLIDISHDQILSFTFTNADLLFLKSDSTLKCKVFNKIGSRVVVCTPHGIREIDNELIKKVENNAGGELKVAGLPPTGPQFVNLSHKVVWSGGFKQSIYFAPILGIHISGLGDWKSQFSPEPSTDGLDVGGSIGFTLNSRVSLGAGFEYFSYQKVKLGGGLEDKVTANYYYFTVQIRSGIKDVPGLFLYAQGDPGYFIGKEKLNYSGSEMEGKGGIFGFRIRGGAEYFTSGTFALFTEITGLFANISDLEVMGQQIPDYSLNFSGIGFLSGIKIYIPIDK